MDSKTKWLRIIVIALCAVCLILILSTQVDAQSTTTESLRRYHHQARPYYSRPYRTPYLYAPHWSPAADFYWRNNYMYQRHLYEARRRYNGYFLGPQAYIRSR